MDDVLLNLSNGTRLYSPAALESITTYVLLEQETWFEKEFAFVETLLAPGMHAIDIGANLGTFSLAMAKAVGPTGRVTAYEPTSSTRASLTRSRDVNGAEQIEIVGRALSDGERMGRIVFSSSSELNHLGGADEGEGEAVEISSLDVEAARFGWREPYFIKIDAEGEEIAILRGGRKLLAETSPVLLLELRVGNSVNDGLIDMAAGLGFLPYRLIEAAGVLMPIDSKAVDGRELNFFAINNERAAELEGRGLLVRNVPQIEVSDDDVRAAMTQLRQQSFAAAFAAPFAPDLSVHPEYARALGAYGIWLDVSSPVARRLGALQVAYKLLRALCDNDGRIGRMSTLCRIAADAGEAVFAKQLCQLLLREANSGRLSIGEPFWPVLSRYDAIAVGDRAAMWFLAQICEQYERLQAYSSVFASPTPSLPWLCDSGFASVEMFRRNALARLVAGTPVELAAAIVRDGLDNVNASLWRDGTVARLIKPRAAAAAG